MNNSFEPDQLRLRTPSKHPNEKRGLPQHKPGELFLKGPVPWRWLSSAARQPGHSLHVAVAIWFLASVKRNRTVKLSQKVLDSLGVTRWSKYRGLHNLEAAKLVKIERRHGRSLTVTILNAPEDDGHAS